MIYTREADEDLKDVALRGRGPPGRVRPQDAVPQGRWGMSSKPNHRRGHGRVQERGPRYESANPAKGCNSTHVAGSRRKWKKYRHRAERRTGGTATGFMYGERPPQPADWGEE
jgi:hypothetical protein